MKQFFVYMMMLAGLLLAVSCQVDAIENEPDRQEAVTVKVCFGSADTKTVLAADGVTPNWAAGDRIWLSDGTDATIHELTASEISGTSATFSVNLSGTTLYAVYPASAVNAEAFATYGKIVFEISCSQTGTFAESNICAAKGEILNGGITLNFKNVTAVMRFEGRTKQIRRIVLPAVNGTGGLYSVDWDEGAPVVNVVIPMGIGTPLTVALADDAKGPYFAAVGPVTIPSGATFSYIEADGTTVAGTKTVEADRTLAINKIYRMGYVLAAGAQGPFTVRCQDTDTMRVAFSMGNLQYQASTGTWRLATQQYHIVGGRNGYDGQGSQIYGNVYEGGERCGNQFISSTYSGWIDLFGWATSGYENPADETDVYYHPYDYTLETTPLSDKNPFGYGPSIDFLDAGKSFGTTGLMANYDWGQFNPIHNSRRADGVDPAGTWRTPTVEEWRCVTGADDQTTNNVYTWVKLRPNASSLRTYAKVAGIEGVIFMPDGWSGTLVRSYTDSEWAVLEKAGGIFIPVGRSRTENAWGTNGSHADDANDCVYWASTVRDCEKACTFRFVHTSLDYRIGDYRRFQGRNVRMVQDIL